MKVNQLEEKSTELCIKLKEAQKENVQLKEQVRKKSKVFLSMYCTKALSFTTQVLNNNYINGVIMTSLVCLLEMVMFIRLQLRFYISIFANKSYYNYSM